MTSMLSIVHVFARTMSFPLNMVLPPHLGNSAHRRAEVVEDDFPICLEHFEPFWGEKQSCLLISAQRLEFQGWPHPET